jgi:class 3 adenylate cyclase
MIRPHNMNEMEPGTLTGVTTQRSLAAIVFTDAAGFSARVGDDEDGTVALIRRDLDLMTVLCKQFEGQVVKSRGDGLMMLFSSAVQAVSCAMEIQKALAERAKLSADEQVLLHRIGIHLGDVLLSDGDALGDGVNVAARLEAEAEPGGICMSQTVYDVVKNRLFLQAVRIGDLKLKNIAEPVAAYKVAGLSPRPKANRNKHQIHWAWFTALGGFLVLLGAGSTAMFMNHRRSEEPRKVIYRGDHTNPNEFRIPGLGTIPLSAKDADEISKSGIDLNQIFNEAEVAREEDVLRRQKDILAKTRALKLGPGFHPGHSSLGDIPEPPIPPAVVVDKTDAPSATADTAAAPVAKAAIPIRGHQSSKEFEKAWKQYARHLDYSGMEQWVGAHAANLSAADLVSSTKYRLLSSFADWFKQQLQDVAKDEPLHAVYNGQPLTAWWNARASKVTLVMPKKQYMQAIEEMNAPLIAALAQALLDRQSGPGASAATLLYRQQLKVLLADFREHLPSNAEGALAELDQASSPL